MLQPVILKRDGLTYARIERLADGSLLLLCRDCILEAREAHELGDELQRLAAGLDYQRDPNEASGAPAAVAAAIGDHATDRGRLAP